MALTSSPTNKGSNMVCGGTSSKTSCQPDQHAEFSIWGSGEEVCRDALFSAIRSTPSSLRMLAVHDIGLYRFTVSVYCLLYRFNCISLHAHDRRSYVVQVLLWPSLLFVRDLILQWLVPHLWHQCLNPTTRTSSIWCQRMTSFKHLGIQSYLWETV